MSTINASFNGSDQDVQQALVARGPRLFANLVLKINSLSLRLQSIIVGKLSGTVLNIRTGKLAGSVRVEPAKMEGDTLVGGVEAAGGPAWYGRIHEYGGTFQVREYIRRTGLNARGEIIRLISKSGAVRQQVASIQRGVVRAHSATFPERSFMRTSVEEFTPTIQSEIADTIANS